MNTGVTTNKNTLGVVLLVISLGTLWRVLSLLRAKSEPNRGRQLMAQGALLAFGISLLGMADCKTCISCFLLGCVLVVATTLPAFRGRPGRVHALCLAIFLVGGMAFLFGGGTGVVHALGRKSDLSGRTEIWGAVIPAVSNSVLGAGFESFWISPDAEKVWRKLSLAGWRNPRDLINEAHDGYIEVYVNLGWIGVCLIALILIGGYRRASKALPRDSGLGGLMLAYIVAAAVYSVTEASFRMLDPIWIFLLLAMVTASVVSSRPLDGQQKILASPNGTANQTASSNKPTSAKEPVYGFRRGSKHLTMVRTCSVR